MVRFTLPAVVGVMGLVALPAVCARAQVPQPGAPAPAQEKVAPGQLPAQGPAPPIPVAGAAPSVELLKLILERGATELDLAELTGMAAGSKPAVLGLEQAYSLTLVRARNPAGLLAAGRTKLFDPAALDEEAKRAGVPDFVRFRGEFVSSVFRDPAPGFLTALQHRQAIDSARDQLTLTENIRRLFEELIRGEASGVSQLQLDQVGLYLLQSRQNLDLELHNYRTAVDELKVLLGLPPSAPSCSMNAFCSHLSKRFAALMFGSVIPGESLKCSVRFITGCRGCPSSRSRHVLSPRSLMERSPRRSFCWLARKPRASDG